MQDYNANIDFLETLCVSRLVMLEEFRIHYRGKHFLYWTCNMHFIFWVGKGREVGHCRIPAMTFVMQDCTAFCQTVSVWQIQYRLISWYNCCSWFRQLNDIALTFFKMYYVILLWICFWIPLWQKISVRGTVWCLWTWRDLTHLGMKLPFK